MPRQAEGEKGRRALLLGHTLEYIGVKTAQRQSGSLARRSVSCRAQQEVKKAERPYYWAVPLEYLNDDSAYMLLKHMKPENESDK